MLYEELSGTIIGAAMEVHKMLGPGFLESVYGHALELELTERQIPFKRKEPVPVIYKRTQIGEYEADLLVDRKIILEIKAVSTIVSAHYSQVLHYLAATGLRLALLLNFGACSLQFRRIIR
jgi:GxxExxY protein